MCPSYGASGTTGRTAALSGSAGLARQAWLCSPSALRGPPPGPRPPLALLARALSDQRPVRTCPCLTSAGSQTGRGRPQCVAPEMPVQLLTCGFCRVRVSRLLNDLLVNLRHHKPCSCRLRNPASSLAQKLSPGHPHWPEPLPSPHCTGLLAEALFCLCPVQALLNTAAAGVLLKEVSALQSPQNPAVAPLSLRDTSKSSHGHEVLWFIRASPRPRLPSPSPQHFGGGGVSRPRGFPWLRAKGSRSLLPGDRMGSSCFCYPSSPRSSPRDSRVMWVEHRGKAHVEEIHQTPRRQYSFFFFF